MDLSGQPIAVLVVEDEPLIRICVAATIEEAGFKVYEAANADEAVGLLAECGDIRVLFTDVEMPGSMDGVALAHYAHSYRPIKIIVTSGRRHIAEKDLPPTAVFVEKPYRPSHVLETLREIATQL
jgi:two-component system, response regulator PdtaR